MRSPRTRDRESHSGILTKNTERKFAVKRKDRSVFNRIWAVAVLVILLVTSLLGAPNISASVVALEQEARCGMEEHIHSDACGEYCLQKQHAHSKNCYLVLLGDNDINGLLAQVETEESHSLERLIDTALSTALHRPKRTATVRLQPGRNTGPVLLSAQPEPELASMDISALNETLRQTDSVSVVLNEDLYDATVLEEGPTDLELPQELQPETPAEEEILITLSAPEESLDTLAVGDNASTSSQRANFYVYLDGAWVCIGDASFSSYRVSTRRYGARMATSTAVNFINDQLGTSLTRYDFSLVYATSANAGSAYWYDATISSTYVTFGTDYGSQNNARAAKHVRLVDDDGQPIPFYTVTVIDEYGNSTDSYVRGGDSFTLPTGSDWTDGTSDYTSGQNVEITGTVTFRPKEDDGRSRIVYNVNFPTVSGVTVSTTPTLYGTSVTTLTDTVAEGEPTVIRNVSQQEVMGKVNNNSTNLSRIIRFSGWQVAGTDIILSANSHISYEELQTYAGGSRLVLNGVWETLAVQTASFFVRYDSVAVDTNGNITGQDSNRYTPEIFATYVGGEDAKSLDYNALHTKYNIADVSADNSYTADQAIRALYGEQPGIWLQSFPTDDYIFSQLKQYAQYLQVDGEPVNVNDLNGNTYTIRWYVFKCQSDAWHIDGRLVKKEGLMHVAKSFAGNKAAVEAAKESFYINAVNADGDNHFVMTLDTVADPRSHPAYTADAKFITPSSYDAASDRYLWQLDGITYGEDWTVTEYPHPVDAVFQTHSDWRVIDIFNLQNKVGTGQNVQVSGVTYATDAGTPEVLRVEFTNIYHNSDAIIIKKEDARTGSPLGGATFQLVQNGEILHFGYNAQTDQYIYDPAGSITELAGSETGYYEIVVTGFSYDNGSISVQELEPPPGYTPVENIVIGYREDGTVGILSQSPMAKYNEGLLVVQNTTEATSVSVKKSWLCPENDRADVTVQLLANGGLVSYLVPGVEPEKVLTAANGYSATWDDLPIYANGQKIVWSVREVKIGAEVCKTDYTFANWIVTYLDPVYTTDENGMVTNTSFTVENDTRRTLLRLTKTNVSGGLRLEGATFTLQHMIPGTGGYVPNPDFALRTMTTGADGTVTFENLLYGYYELRETSPPVGYNQLNDPIYLTITESGQVQVEEHMYAESGSAAYSIWVKNQPRLPMPSTGGTGSTAIYLAGWAMTLGACGAFALSHRKRRKGERKDE